MGHGSRAPHCDDKRKINETRLCFYFWDETINSPFWFSSLVKVCWSFSSWDWRTEQEPLSLPFSSHFSPIHSTHIWHTTGALGTVPVLNHLSHGLEEMGTPIPWGHSILRAGVEAKMEIRGAPRQGTQVRLPEGGSIYIAFLSTSNSLLGKEERKGHSR